MGRLALAASTTIAQYLLPALAGAFIREHPGVELDIMSANTAGAVAALVEGRVRLALIEGPAGRTDVKTRALYRRPPAADRSAWTRMGRSGHDRCGEVGICAVDHA